jgi:hypothetical protein
MPQAGAREQTKACAAHRPPPRRSSARGHRAVGGRRPSLLGGAFPGHRRKAGGRSSNAVGGRQSPRTDPKPNCGRGSRRPIPRPPVTEDANQVARDSTTPRLMCPGRQEKRAGSSNSRAAPAPVRIESRYHLRVVGRRSRAGEGRTWPRLRLRADGLDADELSARQTMRRSASPSAGAVRLEPNNRESSPGSNPLGRTWPKRPLGSEPSS